MKIYNFNITALIVAMIIPFFTIGYMSESNSECWAEFCVTANSIQWGWPLPIFLDAVSFNDMGYQALRLSQDRFLALNYLLSVLLFFGAFEVLTRHLKSKQKKPFQKRHI